MKIAVIGAGAMGSIFGGLLKEAGEDVTFVDIYKEHMDKVAKDGLSIELPNGESKTIRGIKTATSTEGLPKMDLIIIFVKSTVTEEAAKEAKALVKEDTLFITLQNGMGNGEKIAEVVGEEKVLLGVTTCGGTFLGPGKVRFAGKGDTYIGGLKVGEERVKPVVEAFNKAGLPTYYRSDVIGLVWDKLFVNVAINPVTAITGLKNGELLSYEETKALMKGLVYEAVKVAEKRGVKRDPEEVYQHALKVAEKTAKNISSMLQDIMKKRKTEIETINGKIVEYGKETGVSTPYNEVITYLVKTLEKKAQK